MLSYHPGFMARVVTIYNDSGEEIGFRTDHTTGPRSIVYEGKPTYYADLKKEREKERQEKEEAELKEAKSKLTKSQKRKIRQRRKK